MVSFQWRELAEVLEMLGETAEQKEQARIYVEAIAKEARTSERLQTLKLIMTAAYFVQARDFDRVIDEAAEGLPPLH